MKDIAISVGLILLFVAFIHVANKPNVYTATNRLVLLNQTWIDLDSLIAIMPVEASINQSLNVYQFAINMQGETSVMTALLDKSAIDSKHDELVKDLETYTMNPDKQHYGPMLVSVFGQDIDLSKATYITDVRVENNDVIKYVFFVGFKTDKDARFAIVWDTNNERVKSAHDLLINKWKEMYSID